MDHFLKVDGVIAAQTKYIEPVFKHILDQFSIIIEIGFDRGAFSLWLHKNKRDTTKLVSYDIILSGKEVNNELIDFRQGDCFDPSVMEEIKNLIQQNGRALVLCDGGNKEQEFITYCKFLKKGDIIMLHDYAHSHEDYATIINQLDWKTAAESKFENIESCASENGLIPYQYEQFKQVLWGSFEKSI